MCARTGHRSRSPPSSPGLRRSSLPGARRRPFSPSSPTHRPATVPAGARSAGGRWGTGGAAVVGVGQTGGFTKEDWEIKASWKKGECREEIKLVAEASCLSFDDARVVALRLYNHFNWFTQLRERSEQLRAMVGRERHLSPTLVRQAAGAIQTSATDSTTTGETHTHHHGEGGEDGDMCGAGERAHDAKSGFTRYVRGLCALCTKGSSEQTLELLLMAYSTARNDGKICRTEMAAILAKHAVYDDCQDPKSEKERAYRWLKRQFIQLAAASLVTSETSAASKQHGEAISSATAGKEPDGAFISWEFARDLLRRGPHCLENSLAIDLSSLSKDLWTADLVDIARTATVSSR